jgi:hypothetical protein
MLLDAIKEVEGEIIEAKPVLRTSSKRAIY